jgi:integrase
LRWQDLDLEKGQAQIRQTLITVTGKPVFSQPKTNCGRRNVALSPVLVKALKKLRSKQNQEELKCEGYKNSGLVFCQEDGTPYHPDNISKAFQSAVKAAKLPMIRFHDLRHTHATLLLAQGTNPRLISERLGHSSVSFTLQTYAHCLPGQQEEAARMLDEQLFGRPQKKEPQEALRRK